MSTKPVRKPTTKLNADSVRVRFISLKDALKHDDFNNVSCGSVSFSDCDMLEDVPIDNFGQEVILTKKKDRYIDSDYCEYGYLDPTLFHSLITLMDGKLLSGPVKIDDNELTFDEDCEMFSCGCTSFDKDEALKAFKFIGEKLGYSITD